MYRSEYFKRMLAGHLLEGTQDFVSLRDVSVPGFQAVLWYAKNLLFSNNEH